MNEKILIKAGLNIALIVVVMVLGIILHKSGRPYNSFVFTIHKLATVAFVFLIIRMLLSFANTHGMNVSAIVLIVLAAVSVAGLIISGGAMSLDKSHELMLIVHRVSTFVFLVVLSGLFYTVFQVQENI